MGPGVLQYPHPASMNNWYKFIIPLFALAFLLVSCGKPATTETTDTSAPAPTPSGILKARNAFDGTLLTGKHTVVLHTNKGDITVELDADVAPKTVTNFIALAQAHVYDNLTFHRTIPNFMIQGGDPNGDGSGGESIFGPTFEDEINATTYGLDKKTLQDEAQGEKLPPDFAKLTMKEFYEKQGYVFNDKLKSLPMTKGALAMANRGPNTNGSQFFIIHGAQTPWLDGRHTVFGNVTSGLEVVDAIANVEVVTRDPSKPGTDKPVEPITFTVEVKN